MSKVIWTELAYNDIEDIEKYLSSELHAPAATERILARIFKKTKMLYDHPEIGPVYDRSINTEKEYRYLICEGYLIFYYIENDTSVIIHVLHERRDMSLFLR